MKTKEVLELLLRKNLQIAFAESMTGGAIVSELIKYENASKVCHLGLVLYSNQMKKQFANITDDDLNQHGVVSKMIAVKLAESVLLSSYANIGVGITGSAGPTSEPNSKVGEVWVSILYLNEYFNYHFQFGKIGREMVIEKTTEAIYNLIYNLLV